MAQSAQGAVKQEEKEYSEAQIAVHWREEEYYPPPEEMQGRRTPATRRSWSASPRRLPGLLRRVRRAAHLGQEVGQMLDTSNPPFFKWWVGGRLNACVNCVDRHLSRAATRTR